MGIGIKNNANIVGLYPTYPEQLPIAGSQDSTLSSLVLG
jgi:hypothetical protein